MKIASQIGLKKMHKNHDNRDNYFINYKYMGSGDRTWQPFFNSSNFRFSGALHTGIFI